MKGARFKGWFAKLPLLNQPQRRLVLDALHPAAGLDQGTGALLPQLWRRALLAILSRAG